MQGFGFPINPKPETLYTISPVLASQALKQKHACQYAKVERVEKKSTQQVGTVAKRRERKAAYDNSESLPVPVPAELRRFQGCFHKAFFKALESIPKPLTLTSQAQTCGRKPDQDPQQR